MENRFVYFADTHETLSQQQASTVEGGVDFKKLAADLSQVEKKKSDVELERGGHSAAAQAELLGGNEHVTEIGKGVLQARRRAVATAREASDKNDTPENRNKLNKAVKALKKSVDFQMKQIKKQASLKKEFENLAKLPNAKELVKDLKVPIDSKSHSGNLDGLLPKKEFDNLSVKQKEKYLDSIKDILLNGGTEVGKGGIEALRDKLLADKDVPKTWKDWLKNPESWDGPKDCRTLEYAVKWINKGLGEVKHQVGKYENFMSENSHEFNKAGVGLLSVDAFREKSRGKRNEYLDGMESKARSLNLASAEKFRDMQVSEGAEIKTIDAKNVEAVEKEKADTVVVAEKIAPRLEQFAKVVDLAKFRTARENELKTTGKTEVATETGVANLRQRAQSGEKIGAWGAAKNILGFGKKATADDYSEKMEGSKKEENPEERARREVAAKVLGDPKMTEVLVKEMKLSSGMKTEDFAKLESLLTLKKFDAENVRAKLSPEIKNVFKNNAADDFEM